MIGPSLPGATAALRGIATVDLGPARLRLRDGYVFQATAVPQSSSDRSLPPPNHRPPATSLISPRGSALRFHLLAIAEAQLQSRAGQASKNRRPVRAYSGDGVAWTDLLTSSASDAASGRTAMNVREKKVRQIISSLDRLAERGLVELPNRNKGAGKYEGFQLLDETRSHGPGLDPIPYRTPKAKESTLSLPIDFVLQGWLHVLEDTEIAMLLMIACGRGSIDPSKVAIPAGVRLGNYGIGRDAFEAHKRLANLDLIRVEEVGRHQDGRAEDFSTEGASLHRLSLNEPGFSALAHEALSAEIDYQLSR